MYAPCRGFFTEAWCSKLKTWRQFWKSLFEFAQINKPRHKFRWDFNAVYSNNFLKIFTRLSLWLGNLLLRKIDCNLRSSIIITDRIQVTNCLKVKYSCSLANWGYWKRKHRFYFAVRAQIDVKTVASCTELLHNYWCAKITKIFQIKFKMH